MGSVHQFKKGRRPRKRKVNWHTPRGKWRFGPVHWLGGVLAASLVGLIATSNGPSFAKDEADGTFTCYNASVTDGDTIRCGGRRVRLAGIDAPEMPGHCRPGRKCAPGDPYASKDALRDLVAYSALQCRQTDIDHYGRTVARCRAGERDLSCAQIQGGHAIRRYGQIWC